MSPSMKAAKLSSPINSTIMPLGVKMKNPNINVTEPLQLAQAPRCLAKTRRGTACQSPAMPNGRCRIHGGKSPGAPKGNRNAWKHGLYAGETRRMLKQLAELASGEARSEGI